MKENIKEIEDDLMKIKNEFQEKQQNNAQLLQDVLDIRDKIKTEMAEEIRQMNEEVIVQNERIVELGHQIYSTKLFTERKFLQNADLDVRIRSANELFKEVSCRLDNLKSKVHKHKGWINETDRHLKHYVPFQVGTLMFDSLFRSAETPQAQ
jgi:chromosome segregation ATPase